MTKLRGTILASTAIAFLSTSFLYASFVRSAVAHEPELGAATIEHTEEFVELFVYEQSFGEKFDPDIIQRATDTLQAKDKISESETESIPEVLKIPPPTKSTPKPKPLESNISIPDIKVFEVKVQESEAIPVAATDALRLIEEEIHLRSNQARLKRNEEGLEFDETLAMLARERSFDMLERNYFSHQSPDGCGIVCNFQTSSYDTLVWGENIARYEPFGIQTQSVVAEIFVEKWLKSSGHRDNLLSNEYTHEGIGAAVLDGEIVVTVIFAAPIE